MFTVKILEPNGSERGFSIESWIINPNQRIVTDSGESNIPITIIPTTIYLYKDTHNVEEVREGDVYIMNANGKTVADYHLGQQISE